MVAGGDTPENYLKDSVDWILEICLIAIELLITGTVFQKGLTVLVAQHKITLNVTCVCTETGNQIVP